MLRTVVTALLGLLFSITACSPAAKPAKKAAAVPPTAWTCPDTGIRWLTYMDSSNPDRPWKAPTQWTSKVEADPVILPGLHLNYSSPGADGKPDLGSREFFEPNLPWVGDLNGDGLTDVILREGVGFSKETAILVNCGGDRYFQVLHGMTDEILVEDDPDSKQKWKRLHQKWWPIGSDEATHFLLRWDEKAYAKCCEYQDSADSSKAPLGTCCP